MKAILAIAIIAIVSLITNSAHGQTMAGDFVPKQNVVTYAGETENSPEVVVTKEGDDYQFSNNVKMIKIYFNGKCAHKIVLDNGKASLNWNKNFSFQCFDDKGNKIFSSEKKFFPIK